MIENLNLYCPSDEESLDANQLVEKMINMIEEKVYDTVPEEQRLGAENMPQGELFL